MEVLISMAIFVSFTGVLLNSYMSIVKEQREANEYRTMYSQARTVFDQLTGETRDSAIYYTETDLHNLVLLSKDGQSASRFEFDEGAKGLCFTHGIQKSYFLNSDDVSISAFNVLVSPSKDPYLTENVYADSLQFQPKVTIFARFEKEISGGKIYEMDLSTTISSRMYGPVTASEDLIVPASDCGGPPSLNPFQF